jgi:hypothetical protein
VPCLTLDKLRRPSVAPTVLDLLDGRSWGYITPEFGQALVAQDGNVTDL